MFRLLLSSTPPSCPPIPFITQTAASLGFPLDSNLLPGEQTPVYRRSRLEKVNSPPHLHLVSHRFPCTCVRMYKVIRWYTITQLFTQCRIPQHCTVVGGNALRSLLRSENVCSGGTDHPVVPGLCRFMDQVEDQTRSHWSFQRSPRVSREGAAVQREPLWTPRCLVPSWDESQRGDVSSGFNPVTWWQRRWR